MKQGKTVGYIVKVPVTKVETGMQVLWNDLQGTIYKVIETSPDVIMSPLGSRIRYKIDDISALTTLKVEYDPHPTLKGQNFREITYQIPLKYSQWSAAIENQEVNNPANPIFFEKKVYDCEFNPLAESYDTKSVDGATTIAKIIPVRNLVYTSNELRNRMYQFCIDHNLIKPIDDGKHIIENIEDWLKTYDIIHKPKALR